MNSRKLALRREQLTDLDLAQVVGANQVPSLDAYCLTDLDGCKFTSWITDLIRATQN